MLKITAQGLTDQLSELTDLEQRQIPFATALALTRTAQDVKAAIEAEMPTVFDRPTNWTLNSLRLIPARKDRLLARVWIKDEADKSSPATKWLAPEVYGGDRPDKRSEAMLRARGILPAGKYVVPGAGADLDQYGNIKRGQLTKALSGIRGFGETGYNANATDSKRSLAKRNAQSFFVLTKAGKPIGIARRTGRKREDLSIFLAFVDKPTYRKRLDFFGIGERVANERLAFHFEEAMAQAMRTRLR
jgi:hypothetical protein